MLMPTVRRYMTLRPTTVSPRDPVAQAGRCMQESSYHHVPVVDRGALVGMVTDRDLRLLQASCSVDPEHVVVEQLMSRTPVSVSPDAPLDEVAELMSARHIDAVVAVDRDAVAGILTATDALRALADVLGREAA